MFPLWYLLPARVRSVIKAWRNPPIYPSILQIEPTNRCNLRCIMCPHGCNKIDTYYDLSLDAFKKIVSEVYDCGNLKGVHIQGLGEPLLYKHLIEAIQFCKERNLETYFNTNLTLMTEEIAEQLVDLQHDRIAVSVDTVDKDLYLWLRPGAKNHCLDRVLENLKKLSEIRKKKNSKYPIIAVYAILLKSTVDQIPEMASVYQEAGADMLCFQHLITGGIPKETTLPNGNLLVDECAIFLPDDEKKKILETIKLLNTDQFHVIPPHDFELLEIKRIIQKGILTCFDLWEKPTILSNGVLYVCCYSLGYKAFEAGNIYKSDFKSIWFSKTYEIFRKQHVIGKLNKICANCGQLYQVFQTSGCLYYKKNKKQINYYPIPFVGTRSYSLS